MRWEPTTLPRFPYLADFGNYSRSTPAGSEEIGYNWGDLNSPFRYPGLTYTRVSSNNVTWEIAKKHELGLDLYLWGDKFGLTVDYFNERRDGIYMVRSYLPDMVGIQGQNPSANIGSVKNNGFDGNFKLDHKIGEVSMQVRGNFTYSRNEITEADELVNRYPSSADRFSGKPAKGLIALVSSRIMRISATGPAGLRKAWT